MKRALGFIETGTIFLVFSAVAFAQQSTQFRGDATHSGSNAGTAPESIKHVLWKFQTGAGVFSSPVVAGGVVFVGSNDHYLYALDARKGKELWKFKTGANIASTPAVIGGVVFFLSNDGSAYAVNAQTGKLKWKFETGGESRLEMAGLYGIAPSLEVVPDPWDFYISSPTVVDGSVYFGSGDHNIYALDAATGKLQWKAKAGDVVHSSPAVADGVLYIGCWDGMFFALDAKTGQLRWKFSTGVDATHFMQGIPGSPAISAGVVVFGSRDNNIYALEAATGKLLWKLDNQGSWVIASPAIEDGVVYVTTSDSMKLRALDLMTGQSKFEVTYKAYGFSSPTIAAGHAYFGTFDGYVYDVNLAGRKIAGEFRVQASIDHRDLLTPDGHLNQSLIYGPQLPDGQSNNTIDATIVGIDRLLKLGSILATPSVADGVVYAASADGAVYALD
jgi:outer membrane protein assembly factor BamB